MAKNDKEVPYTKVPNYIIRDPDIDPHEKVVLMAIASCNPSYPSVETISEWTGVSTRKIIMAIDRLKNLGLIKVKRTGRSNHYQVTWKGAYGAPINPGKVHTVHIRSARGAPISPKIGAYGAPQKEQGFKKNKKKGIGLQPSGEKPNPKELRKMRDLVQDALKGKGIPK